jgi:hypothetical protein
VSSISHQLDGNAVPGVISVAMNTTQSKLKTSKLTAGFDDHERTRICCMLAIEVIKTAVSASNRNSIGSKSASFVCPSHSRTQDANRLFKHGVPCSCIPSNPTLIHVRADSVSVHQRVQHMVRLEVTHARDGVKGRRGGK